MSCDHFELTDLQAGESFKRWQASPDEVLLADRAYAHREAVGALLEQGVNVVVRGGLNLDDDAILRWSRRRRLLDGRPRRLP